MTITLGLWIIPAIITLAVIAAASRQKTDGFGDLVVGLACFGLISFVWAAYFGLVLLFS